MIKKIIKYYSETVLWKGNEQKSKIMRTDGEAACKCLWSVMLCRCTVQSEIPTSFFPMFDMLSTHLTAMLRWRFNRE